MRRKSGWILFGAILALGLGLTVWFRWPRHDPWPPRLVIPLPAASWVLGPSADGRSIWGTIDGDKTIVSWDLTTGERRSWPPGSWVDLKSFAPDGRTFAGGGRPPQVRPGSAGRG